MTSFAVALVTAAFQVTLVALLAVAVIAWIGRRSPRTGANMAAATLAACALLSIVAVAPMPHWWAWDAPTVVEAPPTPAETERVDSTPPANYSGLRIPLGRLTSLLAATAPSPATPESRWNASFIVGGLFLAGLTIEAAACSRGYGPSHPSAGGA